MEGGDCVEDGRGVGVVVCGFEYTGFAQQLLGVLLAVLGQVYLLGLLVDPVVALASLLGLPHQPGHDAVDLDVQVRGFVGRAGDDQRGARLVDQDRVDFVDDREVEAALETRSEEHTSELQSLMRIPYAVFCLKKKKNTTNNHM